MSRQPRLFEPEVPIPEELREAVDLWLAYQREQWRFTYKPLALAILLERMAAWGPERALIAVKWSMGESGRPFKGLFEPPKGNGVRQDADLQGGRLRSFYEMKQEAMVRELMAPGFRAEAPAFEVTPRLAALAAALPSSLSDLAARVAALGGEPQQVEDHLAALDREMLHVAGDRLSGKGRAEVDDSVESTLALLAGRLPAGELAASRSRLFAQALRRRLELPVLSLFSPEAEP